MGRIVGTTGYCPELGQQMDVEVVFAEIPILGQSRPGYKATSLRCEYAGEHGCSYDVNCPLFKEAQAKVSG